MIVLLIKKSTLLNANDMSKITSKNNILEYLFLEIPKYASFAII